MSTKYEFYDATSDGGYYIRAGWWAAMSFTLGTVGTNVGHTVSSVKLNLKKAGTPTATLVVGIKAVDSNGKPTGIDLYTGSLLTSSLTTSEVEYEITMTGSYRLAASTQYAIVVRCPNAADDGNYPYWYSKGTGAYTGGGRMASTDSGTTWAAPGTSDFIFEVWGTVIGAIVFTQPCTAISTTIATGNGILSSIGSSAVTQHGHCWSTAVDPTTADSKTTNGAGTLGAFTSAITGLLEGLTYYVRTYATNTETTVYGNGVYFIAGLSYSQMLPGNIGVKTTTFRYVGEDGIGYYVQGVPLA